MKFVQIIDDVVVAEFSCMQDEKYWPGVVEINEDDERYLEYVKNNSSIY